MLMQGINKEARSVPNRTLIVIIYNIAPRGCSLNFIYLYNIYCRPSDRSGFAEERKIRNAREFIVMKGWRFIGRYRFTNDPISWSAPLVLIMVNSCKQDLPRHRCSGVRHYTGGGTRTRREPPRRFLPFASRIRFIDAEPAYLLSREPLKLILPPRSRSRRVEVTNRRGAKGCAGETIDKSFRRGYRGALRQI